MQQKYPELVNIDKDRRQMMPTRNMGPMQHKPQARNRMDTLNTLQPEPMHDCQLSFKTFVPLIMGLFLMLILRGGGGGLMALSFGAGLFVTGFLAFKELQAYKPEKRLTAALCAAGGGVLGLSGILSMLMPSLSSYLVFGVTSLLGVILAAAPIVSGMIKKKRCTEKIRAVCIGNRKKRSSGKHHNMVYAPIWQYIFGGRTFVHYDEVYTSPQQFQEGEGTDLLVNPNDPNDIYRSSSPLGYMLTLFGVLMVVCGVLGFLSH